MALCRAYFDASGHPDDRNRRHLAVAGFIAPVYRWRRFERKWEKVLNEFDVSALHMNRLAQWAKPFDSWDRDEAKRVRFIQGLIRAIKTEVRMAFSQSVSLDDYESVNQEYELDSLCTPYGLCASQIVSNVQRWMRKKHPDDEIKFFFEKGDLDQGDLVKMLARRKMNVSPQLLPKRLREENGELRYVRPFEACDLLAYEDGLAVVLVGTGQIARKSFQHLSKQVPAQRSGFRRIGLLGICESLQIPRRKRGYAEAHSGLA